MDEKELGIMIPSGYVRNYIKEEEREEWEKRLAQHLERVEEGDTCIDFHDLFIGVAFLREDGLLLSRTVPCRLIWNGIRRWKRIDPMAL